MRYGLTLTTPPASEPLALADLKTYLRIDGYDASGGIIADPAADPILLNLIADARARFERASGKALVASGWTLTQDWFWDVGITYIPGGPIVTGYIRNDEWRAWQERGGWGPLGLGMIRLPRSPLTGVSQITYVDSGSGSTLTVATSAYQVDTSREPGRLAPAFGLSWPSTRAVMDAVGIVFQAGYPVTTIALATSTGSQTVTPGSMAGIALGSVLAIDPATTVAERVIVTAAGATTFTAIFANAHGTNAVINNVPADVLTCLKRLAGIAYENRDTFDEKTEAAMERLIAPHCDWTYR